MELQIQILAKGYTPGLCPSSAGLVASGTLLLCLGAWHQGLAEGTTAHPFLSNFVVSLKDSR